ncbi:MAG: NUDIX domain-containing protein [Alphaproteobacteria bacterium]
MHDGFGLANPPLEIVNVTGILVAPDGRYLMQLRDDIPGIVFPGYWGCFGGGAEPGESMDEAFIREIEEELSITPTGFTPFTDMLYRSPLDPSLVRGKLFFVMPVSQADMARMVQCEGADMRLFTMADLLVEPKVIPSDIYGLLSHHATIG